MKWKIVHVAKSGRIVDVTARTTLEAGCHDFALDHACVVVAPNVLDAVAKAKTKHPGIT